MRVALRELLRDAWILPIAAAAAIAYAAVTFLRELVDVIVDLIVRSNNAAAYASQSSLGFRNLFQEPMLIKIGDRIIYLQPLLESLLVLLLVVAGSALALRRTTRDAPVELDA